MEWLPVFLHLFALGILGAITVVPFREIGGYYFRFHATLALLPVVLAVLLGRPWQGLGSGPFLGRVAAGGEILFALAVLVGNGSVRAARRDLRPDALLLPLSIGVPFVAAEAFARTPVGAGESLLLTLHLLTSTAVLGTSFVAMTTGHWYLSDAKLPSGILVRLSRAFVLAVASKALVAAIYAVSRGEAYRGLEEFNQLVMGARALAGVAGAMVLGLMALSCARRKATQSATGILYVAVVFVLIGETISMYLTLGKNWPL